MASGTLLRHCGTVSSTRPRLTVFDLDGTLTRRDTSLAYLRAVGGSGTLLRLVPVGIRGALERMARGARSLRAARGDPASWGDWEARVHEAAARTVLAGRRKEDLQAVGRRFAREGIEPLLRPEMVARLEAHRTHGDVVVLVTASLELSVEAWAEERGFHHALGTRLEVDAAGRVTGRFQGAYCWGREKVRRLEEEVGSIVGWHVTAYGDSAGDGPLLERADRPVWVDKGGPREGGIS